MNSKFDLVLEGHASLDRKIDNLAKSKAERFDLVDFKIDVLNQKIHGVVESLNIKIDGVD